MYVFKYPEQAERPSAPWYLRQTAIYHQVRLRDRRSTYLMISPYPNTKGQKAATEWFLAMNSASEIQSRAFAIHDVLFSCYLPKHRSFATCFEERIEYLVSSILTIKASTDAAKGHEKARRRLKRRRQRDAARHDRTWSHTNEAFASAARIGWDATYS